MRTVEGRFWAKVDFSGPCWIWTAHLRNGYGIFQAGDTRASAHRFSYELLVGPIPDGLQLDHLCRVRSCVNPDHLEPVTGRTNWMRGFSPSAINALKTHCKNGHEFTPENTWTSPNGLTGRQCITCLRTADNARPRKTDRGRHSERTHCPKGHEYTEANTYRSPGKGERRCRECHKIRERKARQTKVEG